MEFRTPVEIPRPPFQIEPLEEMLFVGSCFAESIGRRFSEEQFRTTVNPFGTMYNPASVLHTIERFIADKEPSSGRLIAFLTLGTNHVYRLKETGEIVDNCQKRPQSLFQEEELSIDACADYLRQAVNLLAAHWREVHVVLTVSPIRYRKYGFHESQLSKATLLLAVNQLLTSDLSPLPTSLSYFPAYEIVLDELRDYRFYTDDMLHPSSQAVAYIWEQLEAHYFSPRACQFIKEWAPLKKALAHHPFHPDSPDYLQFKEKTQVAVTQLLARYS